MTLKSLREEVCFVNREISRTGLAMQTWGNASGVDRDAGTVLIKPSGIDYGQLTPDNLVAVSLETGEPVEGTMRPSSDTPTHLHLYRCFESIGGVVHTHSHFATVFAQAHREIPCFGTTPADSFYGPIPLTRDLTEEEVKTDYELNTGRAIEEHFARGDLDPATMPGVLCASHAPFAWGDTPAKALENALVLEEVARMALHGLQLEPALPPVSQYLLDKHFLRKHGTDAYYGQPE